MTDDGEIVTVSLMTQMNAAKLRQVCLYFGMHDHLQPTETQMRTMLAVTVTANAVGRAC